MDAWVTGELAAAHRVIVWNKIKVINKSYVGKGNLPENWQHELIYITTESDNSELQHHGNGIAVDRQQCRSGILIDWQLWQQQQPWHPWKQMRHQSTLPTI